MEALVIEATDAPTETVDLARHRTIGGSAYTKSVAHFARPKGASLTARTEKFYEWQNARSEVDVWPYARALRTAPHPVAEIVDQQGKLSAGINFASQDYLSLSTHPMVKEAAVAAIEQFGLHSAGSPVLLGNSTLSLQLAQELAEVLQMPEVTLYPTGWAAGYGVVTALMRANDHIVMDELAHACLRSGAHAATRNVTTHRHLDTESVRQHLHQIRAEDTRNGILVIAEGLYSMDSDIPDLAALQNVCNEFEATLLVDVAHDFGSLGDRGGGALEMQNMLGKVDLVMGSFSKTFASNGGLVATNSPSVKQYLKYYGSSHTFSNALSPVQVATVRAALQIVRSEEGHQLRSRLMQVVLALRAELQDLGLQCMGSPSAIVPVPIGDDKIARIASRILAQRGVLTNLVEFPAVAVGAARFRMQAMAAQSTGQARDAAGIVAGAIAEAERLAA